MKKTHVALIAMAVIFIHGLLEDYQSNTKCRRLRCYGAHENLSISLSSVAIDGETQQLDQLNIGVADNIQLRWVGANAIEMLIVSAEELPEPVTFEETTYDRRVWEYRGLFEKD